MSSQVKKYYFLILIAVISVAVSCSSGPKSEKQEASKSDPGVKTSSAKRYSVDLATDPPQVKANQPVKLIFAVKDPSGKLTSDFEIVHEKPMHLLITSDDLALFDHIHPQPDKDGKYVVETKFPSSGKYKLFVDYTPKDEDQQIGRLDLDVEGPAREHAKLVPDKETTKVFEGLKVTMKPEGELKAGEPVKLNFIVNDAKTGEPIKDLEPYLGAMAHFVIISEDTREFLHAHPADHHQEDGAAAEHTAPEHGGPEVSAHTTFPKPGIYKTWAQFQRGGKVIIANFIVNVAEGETKTDFASANIEDGVQKIKILIKGEGYEPSSFKLKQGIPAQITFLRQDELNCGEQLVFKELNIHETLPVGKPVVVKLIPDKDGTFGFTCGMGMYQGSIVVTN